MGMIQELESMIVALKADIEKLDVSKIIERLDTFEARVARIEAELKLAAPVVEAQAQAIEAAAESQA